MDSLLPFGRRWSGRDLCLYFPNVNHCSFSSTILLFHAFRGHLLGLYLFEMSWINRIVILGIYNCSTLIIIIINRRISILNKWLLFDRPWMILCILLVPQHNKDNLQYVVVTFTSSSGTVWCSSGYGYSEEETFTSTSLLECRSPHSIYSNANGIHKFYALVVGQVLKWSSVLYSV